VAQATNPRRQRSPSGRAIASMQCAKHCTLVEIDAAVRKVRMNHNTAARAQCAVVMLFAAS